MSSIGRQFDRASSSIYPLLERTGGIRPAARTRSRLALTLSEREEISRGLTAKQSLRSIARTLHRSPSTISREVRRNGGAKHYRAAASDLSAWSRAHRPKPCKLVGNDYLCGAISAKLKRKWSPQQIAGWLMREHPDGCWQTNSNSSLLGQSSCPLCRAKLTPLSKSSGAVELEIWSGIETAFRIEKVVD